MGSLRKFLEREPRFTLGPKDNRRGRFAQDESPESIHTSTVIDLSMSGTAFVVSRQDAPFIFERIRIEVPLGEDDSIAWWGKVVRIQEHKNHSWLRKQEEPSEESDDVLVGVQFEPLPLGHATKVDKVLQEKFKEVEDRKKQMAWQSFRSLCSYYTWEILLYCFVIMAGVWILWALSQPYANYTAEKGAPWGKRVWFAEPDARDSK